MLASKRDCTTTPSGGGWPSDEEGADSRIWGAAGKILWAFFPFREVVSPGPDGSGVGAPLRTTGEFALRRAAQHAVQHALVGFWGVGIRQTGEAGVDHVLYPREAQLARIDSGDVGGGAHGATHQIVGRYRQHQFFGHHGHP